MPLAFCGERTVNRGQLLISAGCAILLGTAIDHQMGYTSMARAMGASDVKPAVIAEMNALWLMFSLPAHHSQRAGLQCQQMRIGQAVDFALFLDASLGHTS